MKDTKLAISDCRCLRPYSRKEYLRRILWGLVGPLFVFSPRPMFAWRCFLLRLFGAKVGRDVHIYPSTKIYLPWNLSIGNEASLGELALIYNLGPVIIAEQATISHRAHLCAGTHDYSDPKLPLQRLPITIKARAWVCADAFIGPNVTVGEGAIVGAASVVLKDVPAWSIVAGNPAKFIKDRQMVETRS